MTKSCSHLWYIKKVFEKLFSTLFIQEGKIAFEVKDYLIEQERVEFVELDQDIYPGKYSLRKHEL